MKKNYQALLPWHINNTLAEAETQDMEAWLQENPEARAYCDSLQHISKAVGRQELVTPSIQVRSKIINGIQRPIPKQETLQQWAWGIPLTLLFFVLLWLVIQPGTQLQWDIGRYDAAIFRIYRAQVGSTDFDFVVEIPASPQQKVYQYTDPIVLPGQNYHYMIEVTDQSGHSASSQITANDSALVFAAQFAILLTSFMLTFGIITIAQAIGLPKFSLFAVY